MSTALKSSFLNFSIQGETFVSQTPEVPPEREKPFAKCTKRGKRDTDIGLRYKSGN